MNDDPYHREHKRERENMRQNTVNHQLRPKQRADGKDSWCCFNHYSKAKSMQEHLESHPAVGWVNEVEGIVQVHHEGDRELDDVYQAAVEAGYTVESGIQTNENGEYFEIGVPPV